MGGFFAGHLSHEPRRAADRARESSPPAAFLTERDRALNLQRSVGNQAVTRLLHADDSSPALTPLAQSPGQPLDPGVRTLMEARLGHDFSRVRVHSDPKAAQAAHHVNAAAFTIGHDVVFGANAPSPQSKDGWQLLAHELAHVVQQRAGGVGPAEAGLDAEQEADDVAAAITAGSTFAVQARTGLTLARQGPGGPPATSPLTLPAEGVDMPWVGKNVPSSELGYMRDFSYFWTRFQASYSDRLSPANRTRIAAGQAPIVDSTWVAFYPQHAAYLGETLEHHHVGQGSRAVPMPETLHDAYTVFHPQRRVVGTPTGGTRPLPPQPTRQGTVAEIGRHVTEQHIRGPGISPGSPPPAPVIPVSSELAAVPGLQGPGITTSGPPVGPSASVLATSAAAEVHAPADAPVSSKGPAVSAVHAPAAAGEPAAGSGSAVSHVPQAAEAAPLARTGPRVTADEESGFDSGALAGAAADIITLIAVQHLQEKQDEQNEQKRRAELTELQPEIEHRLAQLQGETMRLQAAGKRAYANVSLLEYYGSSEEGITYFRSVRLQDVKVSDQDVQEVFQTQLRPTGPLEFVKGFLQWSFGSATYKNTFSWELPLLEAVKAHREEMIRQAGESARPLANIKIAPREDPLRRPSRVRRE